MKIAGPIAGPVGLGVTGLPAGVTGKFAPSTFSSPGTYVTSLTLAATTAAPSGKWTINLTAGDGVTTFTVPLALTIP
jgi:hypothetical protein